MVSGPPQAVLFDFHDTLAELIGGTDHVVAHHLGVSVDELRAVWNIVDVQHLTPMRRRGEWPGDPSDMWYRLYGCLFQVLGRSDDHRELTDLLIARFRSKDSYRAYPDARPALERLRARDVRLGLLSNSDFDLHPVLEHIGLGGLFEAAVPAFARGVEKPDPAAFALAVDELGTEPEHCWFVGDHPEFDAVASDQLGMTAVLVDREDRHGEAGWPFARVLDLTPVPAMIGA